MFTAAALTLICLVSGLCQAILNDFINLVDQLGSSAGGVIVHTWEWLLNAVSDHPETPSVSEPGEDSGARDWRQDKMLSPGEIKALEEALRKEGMTIHDLKEGRGTDLYKDRWGNIYEKPKGGAGPGEPTGYNLNDL